MKAKGLVLLLLPFLAACASFPQYPASWPQRVAPGAVDISGSYVNEDKKGERLTDMFMLENAVMATRIEIEQTSKGVQVTAWKDDERLAEKTVSFAEKGGARICPDGVYIGCWDKENTEGAGSWAYKDVLFTKSMDGALVMKTSVKAAMILFVSPMAAGQRVWHRFPRVEKQ